MDAMSTEHSLSELGVIETNSHRVETYFLYFILLTEPEPSM